MTQPSHRRLRAEAPDEPVAPVVGAEGSSTPSTLAHGSPRRQGEAAHQALEAGIGPSSTFVSFAATTFGLVAESDARAEADPWRALALQHLGLLATVGAWLYVVLTLLALAQGSSRTAYAILQAGGATNVLLSAGLSLAPVVLTCVLAFVLVRSVSGASRQDSIRQLAARIWLVLVVAMAAVLFAPAVLLAGAIPMVVVMDRLSSRSAEPTSGSTAVSTGAALGFLTLVGVVYTPGAWASESLTTSDGRTVAAFVMEDGADELVVLGHDDRRVNRIPTSDLTERTVCDPRSGTSKWLIGGDTLWTLHSGSADYPAC